MTHFEKNIHDFVKKKCSCIKNKKSNEEQLTPLVNIVTKESFKPISSINPGRDQEYFLIVVDNFTKYVQAFPTKNKSGRKIANLLFSNYIYV